MTIDIGFLGLGQIGATIARRLESPDVRLHIYDPVAETMTPLIARGAVAHESPRTVADAATIVFACLPNPEISLRVAEEIAGGAAIATYVELSTIGRPAVERIADRLAPHRIALVDAPVSGGPDRVRSGELTMMVAAAPETRAQVRHYLDRIAGKIFEVGDAPGLGQTMKLVNNLIAAANAASTAEAMILGAKAGLDPDIMVRVLNTGSGQNSATSWLFPNYILNGRFDFGAAIATMLKDVELGLGGAAAMGLPMPVLSQVADLWRRSATLIGPGRDMTMFVKMLEDEAQVRIRSKPDPS